MILAPDINIQTYFLTYLLIARLKYQICIGCRRRSVPELNVGPTFLTRPTSEVTQLELPRINMKLWTRPSPTHVYARLIVLPSAAESFSSSTK